ncbi:luciferase domain-containing protein [Halorussus amylolyticus]|uniref:luciferase domain-containing protein n=1 Tax=Halorussus amylolyticus TaxID=1126242 RepID=UPI00104AB379|nr:luciferase family protein [Halorussus amylolyticus]
MGDQDRRRTARLVDRIIEEVAAWPHVNTNEHRFEGREFTLGPREVGHVHRWGIVDVPFTKRLRDQLISEGKTGEHHVVPESGWTTLYVEGDEDVEHATWLLRLSYLYHVTTLKRTPVGAEKFADVDVDEELAELGVSDEVTTAFERRGRDE